MALAPYCLSGPQLSSKTTAWCPSSRSSWMMTGTGEPRSASWSSCPSSMLRSTWASLWALSVRPLKASCSWSWIFCRWCQVSLCDRLARGQVAGNRRSHGTFPGSLYCPRRIPAIAKESHILRSPVRHSLSLSSPTRDGGGCHAGTTVTCASHPARRQRSTESCMRCSSGLQPCNGLTSVQLSLCTTHLDMRGARNGSQAGQQLRSDTVSWGSGIWVSGGQAAALFTWPAFSECLPPGSGGPGTQGHPRAPTFGLIGSEPSLQCCVVMPRKVLGTGLATGAED